MSDRLGAFQALRRGFVNVRANWELVPVVWFQTLAMMVMMVLACLPVLWLAGVGLADLLAVSGEPAELGGQLRVLGGALEALDGQLLSAPVTGAALASFLLYLGALLVYSFFQAGIYSVLAAGERQALPGSPRSWRLFRTFGLRDLSGWAGRRLWRFFGLLVLVCLTGLVLFGLLVLGFVAIAGVGEGWGAGAGIAAGCGGLLPMGFLVLTLVLWSQLAFAEAAHEGQGMWASARRALHVLGQRLSSVVGTFVLWILLLVGAELALLPATWAMDLEGGLGVGLFLAFVGVNLLRLLISTVLNLVMAGAFLAVCRDVRRLEAPSR